MNLGEHRCGHGNGTKGRPTRKLCTRHMKNTVYNGNDGEERLVSDHVRRKEVGSSNKAGNVVTAAVIFSSVTVTRITFGIAYTTDKRKTWT